MTDLAKEVVKILLQIKAVSLSPHKPFKYTSGLLSPIYTDCRILMSFPKERLIIRDFYIEAMKSTGENFDLIAGTATAGIPHAAWIADKLNLPMVYVRSTQKDHGRENRIEGIVKKGQAAAVIEDLISGGRSSTETVKALRAQGAQSRYIFAIITYGMELSEQNLRENDIKLVSLATFSDLIARALEMGYINDQEKGVVMDWIRDPQNWGRKMGFEK